MKKQILVPIDYSKESKETVEIADKWAQQTKMDLHFLHVEPSYLGENSGRPSHLSKRIDSYLKQFKLTSNYQKTLRFGVPSLEIIDMARSIVPELIILATHSYSFVDRIFVGNTTDHVVHHCNCPVYIYKQQIIPFENKIIVPIDYTAINQDLIYLAELEAQRNGAELYFIHTDPLPKYSDQYVIDSGPYQMKYELPISEMMLRDRESKIVDLQRNFEEYINSLGVKSKYQSVFEIGKPYLAIKALQQKIKAKLIIMAAHSHSFLNRLFVGSNTDYLIHHMDCPMYIYKEEGV